MALSTAARVAAYSPFTDEVFLFLLTISHADLATPLRFVNDRAAIVSRGDTFLPYPFGIAMPDEREDAPPVVQLAIDNVSREITDAIRGLSPGPTITMELVLADSPDTLEAGPFACTLREMTYDPFVVQGSLGFEDLFDKPYSAEAYTPDRFPALF